MLSFLGSLIISPIAFCLKLPFTFLLVLPLIVLAGSAAFAQPFYFTHFAEYDSSAPTARNFVKTRWIPISIVLLAIFTIIFHWGVAFWAVAALIGLAITTILPKLNLPESSITLIMRLAYGVIVIYGLHLFFWI